MGNAIKKYQAAVKINADRAKAFYYLGKVFLTQGLYKLARYQYQVAINLNEKYSLSYVSLGKVFVFYNDCENSLIQFNEALLLIPYND